LFDLLITCASLLSYKTKQHIELLVLVYQQRVEHVRPKLASQLIDVARISRSLQ
jgi:hypothetical protein